MTKLETIPIQFRDSTRSNCVLVIDFVARRAVYGFQAMHGGEAVGSPRTGSFVFAEAVKLVTAPKTTWTREA